MRIYHDTKNVMREILRDIQERGVWVPIERMQDKQVDPDKYATKEIVNYSFAIIDVSNLNKLSDDLRCHREWCDAEFEERWSDDPQNPGDAWKIRKEVWTEYLQKNNGQFAYTYGQRFNRQKRHVISELKKHPTTRQAIISVFDILNDSHNIGSDRIPCSIYYQFIFRDDKLHVIYNMRSCDYHLHFRNDIYLACKLLHRVSDAVGMKVGNFYMNIGSLHVYKIDWDKTTF